MGVNREKLVKILNCIAETIKSNKLYLTELDKKSGDGDHGINMSIGFNVVQENLKNFDNDSLEEILKKTGMILAMNVSGASGPLYGTAFIKASQKLNGKSEITLEDFVCMLESALIGIKMRGNSKLGDKTVIDALEPAIKGLKDNVNFGTLFALEKAKESALNGALHTKDIVASRGRASYLGESGLGHQDPGATSFYLILEAIYNELK